jgi:hypothetical protein
MLSPTAHAKTTMSLPTPRAMSAGMGEAWMAVSPQALPTSPLSKIVFNMRACGRKLCWEGRSIWSKVNTSHEWFTDPRVLALLLHQSKMRLLLQAVAC